MGGAYDNHLDSQSERRCQQDDHSYRSCYSICSNTRMVRNTIVIALGFHGNFIDSSDNVPVLFELITIDNDVDSGILNNLRVSVLLLGKNRRIQNCDCFFFRCNVYYK